MNVVSGFKFHVEDITIILRTNLSKVNSLDIGPMNHNLKLET